MTNGTNTTSNYLILVGSTALAMPSKYTVITNEINSSRSQRSVATGKMFKYRIALKKEIQVEWNVLTKAEKNSIVTATSSNTFSMTYFDVETDAFLTGTFYRGSDYSISPLVKYKAGATPSTAGEFEAYSVKMSLIEV